MTAGELPVTIFDNAIVNGEGTLEAYNVAKGVTINGGRDVSAVGSQ